MSHCVPVGHVDHEPMINHANETKILTNESKINDHLSETLGNQSSHNVAHSFQE